MQETCYYAAALYLKHILTSSWINILLKNHENGADQKITATLYFTDLSYRLTKLLIIKINKI